MDEKVIESMIVTKNILATMHKRAAPVDRTARIAIAKMLIEAAELALNSSTPSTAVAAKLGQAYRALLANSIHRPKVQVEIKKAFEKESF